ncbi:MAG: hypothetical protein J7M21_06200 [Planctomycetes bacterium]|nr:hypothetical protein [Planctomycetota bacterium]
MMSVFEIAGRAVAAAVLFGLPAGPGALGAGGGGPASPGGSPALAWIRFQRAPESYAGRAYFWLGRVELRLDIDVPPRPGCALEVLWGAKNDTRAASVIVNGRRLRGVGGGDGGFWGLRVAIPGYVSGRRYEVVFKPASPKAAFIAEVRLVGPGGESSAGEPAKTAARNIRLEVTAASPAAVQGGPVFPEMRKVWDVPLPAPARPSSDPAVEAAFRLAERYGRQANEMYFRSRRLVAGWLAHADPATGLLPRRIYGRDSHIWNAKDCAADLYPFLVLTCALSDRDMFNGRMREILRTEIKLTCRIDRMPDTYSFTKKGFASEKVNLASIMFGSSEYVKDGLMPLTEWLGASPWCDRMLGILDDMWKHAPVETPFGRIVSTNFEVNGEMLQVLPRVYWMTGRKKYLQWALRLGDYYLLGGHHPTRDMPRLSLDDHGCEAISGLCELYAALRFAMPDKAKTYRRPLYEMLDTILAKGRTAHGLFWDWFEPATGRHAATLTDNWGYDLNGFYTVYMVDKTPAYRQAVVEALGSLAKYYMDYKWERGGADGYADSVEGAINLYNRVPVASAVAWIDAGIRKMWRRQKADGIVEGWYGDGNSARTAIMYALMKAQGITCRPWRKDLRLGAVRTGGKVYVSLYAAEPWSGRLVFDRPRHKVQLHLPIDYPRINQFPEWFTVEAAASYRVTDVTAGKEATLTGRQLAEGMAASLPGGLERRLIITPAAPRAER